MSDAEARIAHIKELNRIRAKRYYEANKAKVAERRKAQRAECRQALSKPAPAEEKAPAKEAPAPPAPPAEKKVYPMPKLRKRPAKEESKEEEKAPAPAPKLTYEQAVQVIATSDAIPSEASRTLYRNHLKSVQAILECDDLKTCFMDAKKTVDMLNKAKQKRDPTKDYSTNSKKAYVQMILKLSDVLSIPLSKEAKQEYVDAFDVLKLDSKKQTESRIEEGKQEEVLTFDKYLPKVAQKYGDDSKEYLVASLYSTNGFRDDLQLRVVRLPDATKDNQLILPLTRGGPYRIHMSKYKTGNKYGPKAILVSPHVSKLIQAYTVKHKIKPGQYLFGPDKLSGFISKFNKEMNLPITINTYREMNVAPVIDGMDSKQRVELAKKMNHAPATSEKYRHKKKT